MDALNPRGAKFFFPNKINGFINFVKNLAKIDHKAPPDFINSFICALLNFISVDIFSQLFLLIYSFGSVLRTIHEVNQLCQSFYCLLLKLFHYCFLLLLLIFLFVDSIVLNFIFCIQPFCIVNQ